MVHSLEPEYKGRIVFLVANLTTREGRLFAELHNTGKVSLLFFKPDGTKITTLSGVQQPQYLRKVFNRVFELK